MNPAVSPERAKFLKNSLTNLYETWQRLRLSLDQQSNVTWHKSDETFIYNHITHKKISNKSSSGTGQGQFSQKRLIDFYETWQRVKLPLDQ